MQLSDYIQEAGISLELKGSSKVEILNSLVQLLGKNTSLSDEENLIDRLVEREKLGTTGIGFGVAIPHCKTSEVDKLHIMIGKSTQEIDYAALDGKPVKLFFLLVAPENSSAQHLHALAKIARLAKDSATRMEIMETSTKEDLLELIKAKEKSLR